MLTKKSTFAILLLGILAAASTVRGQDSPTGRTALGDAQQLRPFGGFFRSLFVDDEHDIQRGGQSKYSQQQYGKSSPTGGRSSSSAVQPRAGGVRVPVQQAAGSRRMPDDSLPPPDATDDSPTPARRSKTASRGVTGDNYSFQYDDSSTKRPAVASTARSETPVEADIADTSSGGTATGAATPLHERMKEMRRSVFSDPTVSGPGEETVARRTTVDASDPPSQTQTDRSAVVGRLETVKESHGSPTRSTSEPREEPAVSPEGKSDTRWSGAKATVRGDAEPDVLFTRKSAMLSVETSGPRRIVVGKEAAYEVTVQNSGEVAADGVTVFVALPEWADVVNAAASVGEAGTPSQGRNEPLQWAVGRIEAKGREKLALKIVPRQSKPFELAVRWESKPAASQTVIEVQEPKLAMRLEGPREVLFGKREVYKLKLSNTGTGPAENVAITLMPMTPGDTQPVTHRFGALAAGEERTIEVELTARQSGNLTIQVEAKGDGNVHAELTEKVVVRRASLQLEMEGPVKQFVGTPAVYKVHVRNAGDAIARNVKLSVTLPTGVKGTSATEGAQLTSGGSKVNWKLDQLEPGAERVYVLKCVLALSGALRLESTSTADDDLTASTEALTRVDAIADLRLEVKDPEGPVPVGEDASYEIRIRNRGTKTAENVEVVTYFSNGVEPTAAEGHQNRLSPGQVVFNPIPVLGPGAELVLKVRVRADAAGNHVFRAEVHCKPLGTRLVREETTHFYQETEPTQQAARTPDTASSAEPKKLQREPALTADRRPPLPIPDANDASRNAPRLAPKH